MNETIFESPKRRSRRVRRAVSLVSAMSLTALLVLATSRPADAPARSREPSRTRAAELRWRRPRFSSWARTSARFRLLGAATSSSASRLEITR